MPDTAKRAPRAPAHLDRINGSLRVDARVIRSAVQAAGLGGFVERVTSGRHNTYVRLYSGHGREDAELVADTLRPLWADSGRRVSAGGGTGYGTVYVERYYTTSGVPALPAMPTGDDVPAGLTLRMWATLVHQHRYSGTRSLYFGSGDDEFRAALVATRLIEHDSAMPELGAGRRFYRLTGFAGALVERAG